MNKKQIISLSIFTIVGLIISSLTSLYIVARIEKGKELKAQLEMQSKILEGTTAEPTIISADFTKITGKGSPLIFGGVHSPNTNQIDAWNKMEDVGVSFLRQDIYIESALPKNITLEDYKLNKNDIQNPENWNKEKINQINLIYKSAKAHNMKTMAIVSYIPSWLSDSNDTFGVPKDWVVYKDLVKKSYLLHRDYIDYIEIWNEPSHPSFLKINNSNMTVTQAYQKMFKVAMEAIKEVDAEKNDGKKVPIGGPAVHTPLETSFLITLMEDEYIKNNIGFISYHNYEHLPEPSDKLFKSILTLYNKQHLPIFISEWNYDALWSHPNPYNTSNLAISYTGSKFIEFLKMGLEGANYHTMQAVDTKRPNNGEGTYAFYRWQNNQADLLPQAKTWRLMSKSLGLGKGTSKILETKLSTPQESSINKLNGVGFINSDKKMGIVIANQGSEHELIEFTLYNLNRQKRVKVKFFNATANNDGMTPTAEFNAYPIKNETSFRYLMDENSVLGLIIEEDKRWYDILDPILQNK